VKPIGGMCRMLKFTFSTSVISYWTRLQMQLHRELEVGYCRLVTISTDNIPETNEYRSGVGAHWPFLTSTLRQEVHR